MLVCEPRCSVHIYQAMITAIETAGCKMRANGVIDAWMGEADKATRLVTGEANGPLLEQLLACANHTDRDCADMLRSGRWFIPPIFVPKACICFWVRCKDGRRAKR